MAGIIEEKICKAVNIREGAQRLNNLIMKHEQFRKLITLPESLAASNMLMKDEIALSQIISRMPFQGEGEQAWHIDWIPRKI